MDVVKQGVYALFSGEELVYIGQSTNLYRRIGDHVMDDGKEFDSFELFELPTYDKWDLDTAETTLISWFNPKLNIRGSGAKPTHYHTKKKFYIKAINKIIETIDARRELLYGSDWLEHRTLCKDCAKNQANKIKYELNDYRAVQRIGICHTPVLERSDTDGCTFGKHISECKEYQRQMEWVKGMAEIYPDSKWGELLKEWQARK